jgi:hypothetical protein
LESGYRMLDTPTGRFQNGGWQFAAGRGLPVLPLCVGDFELRLEVLFNDGFQRASFADEAFVNAEIFVNGAGIEKARAVQFG